MKKFRIKQIVHCSPYLYNGVWIDRGWLICDERGFLNLTPGAGWFTTLPHAYLGIEALIAAGVQSGEPSPEIFHRRFRELIASRLK